MIFVLTEGDPYSGTLATRVVLEGPDDLPLEALWEAYEKALQDHLGPYPQTYQRPDYTEKVAVIDAAKKAYILALAIDLGMVEDSDLIDCFVATMIRDHGCKSGEFFEVYMGY